MFVSSKKLIQAAPATSQPWLRLNLFQDSVILVGPFLCQQARRSGNAGPPTGRWPRELFALAGTVAFRRRLERTGSGNEQVNGLSVRHTKILRHFDGLPVNDSAHYPGHCFPPLRSW